MNISFSEFVNAVARLEVVLIEMGVSIPNPSSFQKAREILSEMDRVARSEGEHDNSVDQRDNWRRGFSLGDLATKLVAVSAQPDFVKLKPHLQLLASDADLSLFSFAPKEERTNDLVFELRIAACCLQMMTACDFDDPRKSQENKTPDIIGNFRGLRWAVECKTLHPQDPKFAQSPESFLQRVKDARDQIDSATTSGRADTGIVLISMKNAVDHDGFWPGKKESGDFYYRPYASIEAAQTAMCTTHDHFITPIRTYLANNGTSFGKLFTGKKVSPHALLAYSGIVGVIKEGEPVFTMLRMLACEPDPQHGQSILIFAQVLNNCLQDTPGHPLLEPHTFD